MGVRCERIGLETGSTSSWLCAERRRRGHAVICVDARHAAAALQAGLRNKTDRNDARGLAQLMRLNAFREVWLKSPESHRRGMLLTARGMLHVQRVTLGNTIRGLLRTEGIAFPTRGTRFTEHVLGIIGGTEPLLAIIRPLLDARATIVRQLAVLDRQIIDIAKRDGICRRLMTVPGVGPLRLLEETHTYHLGKKAFEWVYWHVLLPGHPIPLPAHMSMAGKHPVPAGSPPPEKQEA